MLFEVVAGKAKCPISGGCEVCGKLQPLLLGQKKEEETTTFMDDWNLVSHAHWDKVGLVLGSTLLAIHGKDSLNNSNSSVQPQLNTICLESHLL